MKVEGLFLVRPPGGNHRALPFPVGVLLLTGTGIVPEAGFTLRPADIVRISVDGLGTLENAVVEVGRR